MESCQHSEVMGTTYILYVGYYGFSQLTFYKNISQSTIWCLLGSISINCYLAPGTNPEGAGRSHCSPQVRNTINNLLCVCDLFAVALCSLPWKMTR